MTKYRVELVRVTRRIIEVEAPKTMAAKKEIEEYGVAEAYADYPSFEESDTIEMKSVMPVSKVK